MAQARATRQFDLAARYTLIGRGPGADLQIDHPRISRRHAELRHANGETHIFDLGSSNGTYVNGRKVEKQSLRHGDVVRIGDCDMRYLAPAEPDSADLSLVD